MEIIFICTKSITFNTFLKSQANHLLRKGFKVKVACSDTLNLNFKKNMRYKIDFPTKYSHLFNLYRYLVIFKQIKELIKKNKSSIFYLHTPVASHLFRFFSIFLNLKIIYFVHGFRFTSKTNFFRAIFFKIIEKVLSFKTNIFITINNEDFIFSNKNFSNNAITYKINGIGLDLKKKKFTKKIKNKIGIDKIIVIAAYKKSKGYQDLLKIAEALNKHKIKIDCFGYGNYQKLRKIKKAKRLYNISFKKFDVHLKNKIKDYDILLHLSNREGLPVSVMESLLEGLPVICKNIRGNNDLIKDGYNGFFINSNNEAINKIFYLNLENKVFNHMRYNALNTITKNFSKEQINHNIYQIITKNF